MLQQNEPGDYVLATGESHTVREFAEDGCNIRREEEGVSEVGIGAETGNMFIEVNSRYPHPNEVDILIRDSSKAAEEFGWEASGPR